MDILDKAVLMARTARVMVRLEAMKVENMVAIKCGRAVDYRQSDFDFMLLEEGLGEPVKDAPKTELAPDDGNLREAVAGIMERAYHRGQSMDLVAEDKRDGSLEKIKDQEVAMIFQALAEVKP